MASIGLLFRTLATRLSSAARERGASAPEYALLLTVIVGGSLVALGQLEDNTEDEVVATASQIGSMPTIIGFVPIDTTIAPPTTTTTTIPGATTTTTTTTTTSTTTTVAPTTTAVVTEKLTCSANDFTRNGKFRLGSSGGVTYVGTSNAGAQLKSSPNGVDFIECTFTVAQAGTYEIEANLYAPDGGSDSFWVQGVGQSSSIQWRTGTGTPHTKRVRQWGATQNIRVGLGANTNYPIKISLREDGTWLSQVRLVLISPTATTTTTTTTTTIPPTTTTSTTTTTVPANVAVADFRDTSYASNGKLRARAWLDLEDSAGNNMVGAVVTVRFTRGDGATFEQTRTLNSNGRKSFIWSNVASDKWPVTAEIISVDWNGSQWAPNPSTITLQRP